MTDGQWDTQTHIHIAVQTMHHTERMLQAAGPKTMYISTLFCQYGSIIQEYTKYRKIKYKKYKLYTDKKIPNASHGNQ